jgi:RNA:NAD 2'-phosphotransferase (TPT1/KptA family)
MNEDVYISKKMSYALRHSPQKYGLQLDHMDTLIFMVLLML